MRSDPSAKRAAEVLREYADMIYDSELHRSGPLNGRCDEPIEAEIAEYRALAAALETVPLPSVIEQHQLCVAYNVSKRNWSAQDCHYNALAEGATLDEAVQALLPKLIRCGRCQKTTTRTVSEYYCKAEDCEVRSARP